MRSSMPELPEARRNRFMEEYEFNFADATQLVSERSLADYYEAAVKVSSSPKSTANWIRFGTFAGVRSGWHYGRGFACVT